MQRTNHCVKHLPPTAPMTLLPALLTDAAEDSAYMAILEAEGEAWLERINEQAYREWLDQLAEEAR